ncbi:MAG: S8 family peptidase [Williamsia sp.]|nr:S8 family peptidase [Williamsia sp.]
MNKILFFLLLLSSFVSHAQYSRVIVQFKDKNGTPYVFSAPQQFLSARAIQRRMRYGIQLDSTDLPIVPRYLDSVKAQGPVTILSRSKWLNQVLIQTSDSAALQKIRALPFVKTSQSVALRTLAASQPVRKIEETTETSVPVNSPLRTAADTYNYGSSYNQIHIHEGEYLHNKGFSGQGMMIAVLDAGFNNYRSITAFDSIRLRGQVLGERDFVAFDNSVNEDDAHGKNCLSIMAANWPGTMVGSAPWANFWLIRTEDVGSEFPVEEHNWVAGAEFADSCGTDLITSSLGYTTFDNAAFNHTYSQFYQNATMVTQGASLAVKKGMIVTNSAGNEGNKAWKYLGFPADGDSICAVGAISTAGVIGAFSSYGYPGKQKPNIVSVGVATVYADMNSTTSGNGTSYSNPNIAGLIACLWQAFPQFSNMKILNALYASSDRFTNPNDLYGFGIPNMKTAYRTLKAAQNQQQYGTNWLLANPGIFIDTIAIEFVSQTDGNATIDLLNSAQAVVATQTVAAEKEEVYKTTFLNLSPLPAGTYAVRYSDGSQTKTVQLQKSTVLPLFGLQANAIWLDVGVNVKWTTEAESNTGYFTVQRSTNGTDFISLKTVPAAGNSQSRSTYIISDTSANRAQGKILYYRIELVDRDNKKMYSTTVRLLNRQLRDELVVYPNPASGSVQLLLNASGAQSSAIQLFNQRGQLVREQPVNLVNGSNTVTLSLSGLPKAEYIIRVQTLYKVLQEKLVIQ